MVGKHERPSVRNSAAGEDPNAELGFDILADNFLRMIDVERDKAFVEPVKAGLRRPEGPLRTARGYEIEQSYLLEQTATQRMELEGLMAGLPANDPQLMSAVVDAVRSVVGPPGEPSAALRWMRGRDRNWNPDSQAESIAVSADSGESN